MRAQLGRDAVEKEIDAAAYDLERSEQSLKQKDYKWATVKAYYSMFHTARALLYKKGYRERSHAALVTALRELYVRPGLLQEETLSNLENAMSLREAADYGHTFTREGAQRVIMDAKKFQTQQKKL